MCIRDRFKEEAIKAIQETAVGAVNAAVVSAAVNTVRVAGKSKDLETERPTGQGGVQAAAVRAAVKDCSLRQ